MKKNFYLGFIALTALTVTSCSNDDVVMQSPDVNKAIEFGTYLGRDAQSRGSVITGDGAQSGEAITTLSLKNEGFGVFAYYTNNGSFNATTSPANFMYNQEVKVKEGESHYSYAPLKYWPNESSDMLSFFAYAPHEATTGSTNFTLFNGNAGLPTINFTVNSDVKDQQDLLWAPAILNLNKNANKNNYDIDDRVTFGFQHALARIGFEVQTMIDKVNDAEDGTPDTDTSAPQNGQNLDNATTVVVKKVDLTGKFVTSGTLAWIEDIDATSQEGMGTYSTAAITNSTDPTSPTTYTLQAVMETGEGATLETNFAAVAAEQEHSWGVGETKYTVYGQKANQTEAKLNADDSYIMIIPKNFTGEDDKLTITVTYDVVTSDSNLSSGYSVVENVISTSFSNIDFKAGHAYKFSLHLGLTSVKLTATVADWAEQNSTAGDQDYAVNVPLNIANDDN